MLISFTCPHCGATRQVLQDFIGRTGPCAACGQLVTIHAPGSLPPPVQAESTVESAPRASSRQSHPVRKRADRTTVIVLFVFLGLTALAVSVGGYAAWKKSSQTGVFVSPRAMTHRLSCENRLRQIGDALRAYHDKYKSYPPLYTTDGSGRKLHSWRTLILPFMGREALYNRIALDEPWNSPKNLLLGEFLPEYHCDAETVPPSRKTSYVAVVGDGTVWEPAGPIKRSEITDKKSQTLLLIEWHESDIDWMEPRDLDVDTFVNQGGRSRHRLGDKASPAPDDPAVHHAVFADYHCELLSGSTPADTRRAYTTRAGKEKLPETQKSPDTSNSWNAKNSRADADDDDDECAKEKDAGQKETDDDAKSDDAMSDDGQATK